MKRIKAKNRFTGIQKNFSQEVWNRLSPVIVEGKSYPKAGWVESREQEMNEESKKVLEEVTKAEPKRNSRTKAKAKA